MLGDTATRDSHRQAQPAEVPRAAGLRRCQRAAAQLVRPGDQGGIDPVSRTLHSLEESSLQADRGLDPA